MITSTKLCDLILVNYNSVKNIEILINSINKYTYQIFNKIYIIDNSNDDFKKIVHISKNKIKILKNRENIGFAKAVNIGIKESNSDYILLLNPDTEFFNDSIIKSFDYLIKNEKVGIIGGRIIDKKTKNLQFTAISKPSFLTGIFEFTNFKKIFRNNYFSNKFWIEKSYKDLKPIKVTSLCGAYMFLRRKINNNLNLFNEKYFMYMEDIEIGINNIKNNYQVIFDPRSSIYHIGGASNNSKYKIVLRYWYDSRIIFFNENLNKTQSKILKYIFRLEEKLLKSYHYISNKPNE